MPIINHDYKKIDQLESVITHDNGKPLQGEIDMYRRIYADCDASPYTWHFWHDLRLPIPVKNQSEIQIDFFLVCEKGAIVVKSKAEELAYAMECSISSQTKVPSCLVLHLIRQTITSML